MDQNLSLEADAGPQLASWIVWAPVPELSGVSVVIRSAAPGSSASSRDSKRYLKVESMDGEVDRLPTIPRVYPVPVVCFVSTQSACRVHLVCSFARFAHSNHAG